MCAALVAERSANCAKIDNRTAEACGKVAALGEELAAGKEAKALDARITALRQQLSDSRERGGSLPPDPVGEFYAWATRGLVSVRDVGFGFPLFFALLIEVVSAFGPITIARYAELTRPAVAEPDNPSLAVPAMARQGRLRPATALSLHLDEGRVVAWMAERATPSPDAGAVTIEELHDDFQVWCVANALRGVSVNDFAEEFDRVREMPELAGKIRKFGNRYYGMTLVAHASSVPRLKRG